MQYRVLLIEGNRMMLERLTAVIRDTKDFELAGRYQKAGDALKVAAASAGDFDVLYSVSFDLNFHQLRADTPGSVCKFHGFLSFLQRY